MGASSSQGYRGRLCPAVICCYFKQLRNPGVETRRMMAGSRFRCCKAPLRFHAWREHKVESSFANRAHHYLSSRRTSILHAGRYDSVEEAAGATSSAAGVTLVTSASPPTSQKSRHLGSSAVELTAFPKHNCPIPDFSQLVSWKIEAGRMRLSSSGGNGIVKGGGGIVEGWDREAREWDF